MTYKFDEKKHVHTLDGKRLHGVTSVLKMWGDPNPLLNWGVKTAVASLEDWLNKTTDINGEPDWQDLDKALDEARTAHLKKRDKAGDLGTIVHKQLEDLLTDYRDKMGCQYDNDTHECVKKVINWMSSNNIRPLELETHLHSREHWYGGIVDAIVEKDGKKYILDFKTSGTVQTKYFYQMGAYSLAYKERTGENIDGVVIVHIPRGRSFNPEKNVYWRYDVEALECAWLNILNTYKLDKDIQKLVKY